MKHIIEKISDDLSFLAFSRENLLGYAFLNITEYVDISIWYQNVIHLLQIRLEQELKRNRKTADFSIHEFSISSIVRAGFIKLEDAIHEFLVGNDGIARIASIKIIIIHFDEPQIERDGGVDVTISKLWSHIKDFSQKNEKCKFVIFFNIVSRKDFTMKDIKILEFLKPEEVEKWIAQLTDWIKKHLVNHQNICNSNEDEWIECWNKQIIEKCAIQKNDKPIRIIPYQVYAELNRVMDIIKNKTVLQGRKNCMGKCNCNVL